MKGLLVKDLRIIFRRKQQLLILLAICVLIAFSTEGSFVIGYTAILIGMLGLTPLVADERNNGFPFLFSLPVDAKTYVNVASVVSDSVRPHRRQPTRLLRPWDSPVKNTGVGCHVLLQGIFPIQVSNLCLLHCQANSLPLSHQGSLCYFRILF